MSVYRSVFLLVTFRALWKLLNRSRCRLGSGWLVLEVRTNPFAAARRGVKTAMRPFVRILWTVVINDAVVLCCCCSIQWHTCTPGGWHGHGRSTRSLSWWSLGNCVWRRLRQCRRVSCLQRPRLRVSDLLSQKTFSYSLPSVGPGADPGVQVVSPQLTISHPLDGRLPLLSARPAITFPATEHHRPWPVPSYTAWW